MCAFDILHMHAIQRGTLELATRQAQPTCHRPRALKAGGARRGVEVFVLAAQAEEEVCAEN
jgi:hypothetical protein